MNRLPLKRVLTLRTVVATSAGLTLASSTFVAAVQVAGFLAGDAAWLAIFTSGLLCFGAAACFSELNARYPSAAGIRLYFARAFGERLALVVSLLYMAVVLGVVGAESYVLAQSLTFAVPFVPPLAWILLIYVLVTGLNIRGIKMAGNFQDFITYSMMVALVALGLAVLAQRGFVLQSPLATGGPASFINAVAVGIFLFVGFEWAAPLAEEVVHTRLVSRGMLLAVGILSLVYAVFTVAMTAVVPREELLSSPVPHMLFARHALGPAGVWAMVGLSLAASATTFNAGLISVSRFIYASARECVLPPVFSRVSMRFLTPWVAVLTVFVIGVSASLGVLLTGRYLTIVNLAAAMESLVYVLAALAVAALRKKEPAACGYTVRWGLFVPAFTAAVFLGLLGAVVLANPAVGLYLLAGLGLSWLYVRYVVPALKEKYRRERRSRRRHSSPRPGALP